MANLETIQAQLEKMEKDQRIRDESLRRAFHLFADNNDRLTNAIKGLVQRTSMPMEMGAFMELMTTLLNRQQQLLASIGERVETVDADEAWDNAFPDEGLPPGIVTPPGGQ
jgi:hypothetical protein